MTDLSFYQPQGPFSLKEIAGFCQGAVHSSQQHIKIKDIASIDTALGGELTYLGSKKYLEKLHSCKASACLLSKSLAEYLPIDIVPIFCADPRKAFAQVAHHFYPSFMPPPSTAATAIIHPSAQIAPSCCIEDYVIIKENVVIGDYTHIRAHSIIGRGVQIGKRCLIEPMVYIQYAMVGNFVTIKTGAKIGQSGFGFVMDESGHIPIPHLGRVVMEDGVEIGANTVIDRGADQDTIIGAGSRIDNLVEIAHNVALGKNCVIVSQTGIAGSTTLGDYVIIAGQVGIADHLKIGSGVKIAAKSGLMRDVKPGSTVGGIPAVPIGDWHRQTVLLKKLIRNRAQ